MTRAWLLVCVFGVAGCAVDQPCDPGERVVIGSCLPIAQPKPDAGMPDAAASDAAQGCMPSSEDYATFGKTCKDDSDCTGCAAPKCIPAPLNQCSRIECQNDAKACPSGWVCTDISALSMMADVTHICLKQ